QKKHNANDEENSLEWTTPMTRPKKCITKTENNSIQTVNERLYQQKKYDTNDKKNLPELVISMTKTKKKNYEAINKTALAIKKHSTTKENSPEWMKTK
ncbi:16533_t:CDS:2, partial [Gigaspora margarita]